MRAREAEQEEENRVKREGKRDPLTSAWSVSLKREVDEALEVEAAQLVFQAEDVSLYSQDYREIREEV